MRNNMSVSEQKQNKLNVIHARVGKRKILFLFCSESNICLLGEDYVFFIVWQHENNWKNKNTSE